MFPQYIITSRYFDYRGNPVICREVYEGERAFDDALEGHEDESDVIQVIRLAIGGTWEDATDEAHDAMRKARYDAETLATHYRSFAPCRQTHGAA